jgi:hypothetical protein
MYDLYVTFWLAFGIREYRGVCMFDEVILQTTRDHLLTLAGKENPQRFSKPEFMSDARIALEQRRANWKAEAIRHLREEEQQRSVFHRDEPPPTAQAVAFEGSQAKTTAEELSPESPVQEEGASKQPRTSDRKIPKRKPDLETSQKRVKLSEQLARELAIIKPRVRSYRTIDKLRTEFPDFELWKYVFRDEHEDLLAGKFLPKAFAESITMRVFGIGSRQTLKKDRKKIKKAPPSSRL